MFFAVDENNVRIEAAPSRTGFCPLCGDALRAKCGDIRIWHWAHLSKVDCDPWAESESEWHLEWKRRALPERVEVIIGIHRADIVGAEGVIELQHSVISPSEIAERELFYGRMVWLIDGTPFQDNLRVELDGATPTFSWAHPRPSWKVAKRPLFVHGFSVGRYVNYVDRASGRVMRRWTENHASADIFQIRSIRWSKQVEGTGRIIPVEKFAAKLIAA